MEIKLRNQRVDEDLFMKKRREWLDVWPTGQEVDYEESVAYLKQLPDNRYWSKVMAKLRREGRMSVFPRAGTALLFQGLLHGIRPAGHRAQAAKARPGCLHPLS